MFCEKCGRQNQDGAMFCEGCGARLQVVATPAAPAAPAAPVEPAAPVYAAPAAPVEPAAPVYAASAQKSAGPNKLKSFFQKNKLILPIAGAVAVIAIALIVLFSILGRQVSMKNYMEIAVEGYDGYGGVWVEAPESAEFQVGNVTFRLVKGYGRVEWEDKDGDSGTFYIEINYAPKSACNGDVVKAAITVPADNFLLDGVMLTGVEREYTVDGLQESVEVDFLSYYDISFTGPDGYGEIVITPKQEKVTIGTFEVDLTTGAWSQNGDVWVYTEIQSSEYGLLSNGQVFEVYVYFPAGVFSGMGVKFINYRIEVTVSGLT